MKVKKTFYLLLLLIVACVPEKKDQDSNFDPESKLKELGIELMIPSDPVANYVNTVQSGNLLFISGKGPLKNDGDYIKGKLGYDLTIDQGYEAARATGINLISTIKSAIGDLKNVKQIIRVNGMVNSASNFTDQPKVINGASDLIASIFGDAGMHTRAAVSTNSLPLGVSVEVDAIFELN
jgi:enamine deaminase RidA (YjgF/YER057c/UK114 family)